MICTILKGLGYPHNSHAYKNPYPDYSRADKNSSPHEGHAYKNPYQHVGR